MQQSKQPRSPPSLVRPPKFPPSAGIDRRLSRTATPLSCHRLEPSSTHLDPAHPVATRRLLPAASTSSTHLDPAHPAATRRLLPAASTQLSAASTQLPSALPSFVLLLGYCFPAVFFFFSSGE
ncbi:unnamed protein product [Linum trigynum]|uniref:Uncharacterized protein n=1 Tax=Linum trigynum TaxID=586398 RepID=A0AAV2FSL5_9ROSI